VCCQCSWHCLTWNSWRHVGVLPVLMTMYQLGQFETCWCAASAYDSVSLGTVWDMLVCCQCSWQCLTWNSLRHVGVLPVLMTVSQLEQFETCWCAASAHDSVSLGTVWDMLVCCQCLWQCLTWNSLRHVSVLPVLMTVSHLEQFETWWCAASAHDNVSEGTEIRDHYSMSVRNSALYQTRTVSSGRTIGAGIFVEGQYFKCDYIRFYTHPFCYKVCLSYDIFYVLACICTSVNRPIQYLSV